MAMGLEEGCGNSRGRRRAAGLGKGGGRRAAVLGEGADAYRVSVSGGI